MNMMISYQELVRTFPKRSATCPQLLFLPKRLYDKYAEIRVIMADIFEENYRCYDYRRLHAMLRGNNRVISEKVVRRLMAEEQLVVKRTRRRRYNSYCGEIGPAPENLLARDFSSCRPNEKWLTDITEFQLPAGKVYLSPVIDCFDGLVVLVDRNTPGRDAGEYDAR